MTLRKLNRACLVACITSIAIITLLSLSLIWEPEKEHGETFYKILGTAWLILFSAGIMLSISKIYTGRNNKKQEDEPLLGESALAETTNAFVALDDEEPTMDEPPYAPAPDLPAPPPPDSE